MRDHKHLGQSVAPHVWVPNIRSWALARHDALASWGPMCRFLYRFLASLARLAVRSGRSKDRETPSRARPSWKSTWSSRLLGLRAHRPIGGISVHVFPGVA